MRGKHLLPRARAHHYPVRNRVADHVIHGSARLGAELKTNILGNPNQQALTLEGPTDALAQPLDE